MSIVLDALQKAERERSRQQTDVVVGGGAVAAKPRLKPQWKALLVSLVVLNVVLLASFAWFNFMSGGTGNRYANEVSMLRAELTNRAMTSHVWSANPTNRFILIDGKLVREGESLDEDIQLQEITETGVRINYQGRTYPFSIGELWPELADAF